MSESCDIAVVGLAVMGQNLILNMNDNGYRVAAYNRSTSKTRNFLAGAAKDTLIQGVETLEALVDSLVKPRRVMLMVQAGTAVDKVIEQLAPLLDEGDVIIDGGNSNYADSERRATELAERGLLFVGAGVSGGEEGGASWPLADARGPRRRLATDPAAFRGYRREDRWR